jgi:rhodanese-related sulfurtransferase
MLNKKAKKMASFSGDIFHLSPNEAFEICTEGAILIDVREDYLCDYKKFDVPIFFQIPLCKLDEYLSDFNNSDTYVIADSVGLRSKEAIIKLKAAGIENVFNLAGGLVDWERLNLPVNTDISEMLSGPCACQLKYRNINDKK